MKKMVAPVIMSLLFLVVIIGYFVWIILLPVPLVFQIIIGIGLAALVTAMIYVLKERYREMKEEDKDDLSNY